MKEEYKEALEMIDAQLAVEKDDLANLCNVTAILMEKIEDINWVGFYFPRKKELVLGPFQGRAACSRIDFNEGVCGACYRSQKMQLVPDVHEFPGHIACDFRSRSELVYPIIKQGKCLGVLDIDSPTKNRFRESEAELVEHVVKKLLPAIHWEYFCKEEDNEK